MCLWSGVLEQRKYEFIYCLIILLCQESRQIMHSGLIVCLPICSFVCMIRQKVVDGWDEFFQGKFILGVQLGPNLTGKESP